MDAAFSFARNLTSRLALVVAIVYLPGCYEAPTILGGEGAFRGCPEGVTSSSFVKQMLPEEIVDTEYIPPKGKVHSVKANGNLQAAIDAAARGDVIEIEAGATFTGPFVLPNKPGNDWITIRTSTPDADLPPPGVRMGPTEAAKLPKLILSADEGALVSFAPGAHHYRLLGLEIAPIANIALTTLVDIGSTAATPADLPHHIVIDRSYLHGDAAMGTRTGIALGGQHVGIVDSYLADFKSLGVDSRAIGGWNGPGPYKILNNHLESAGEVIIFGGSATSLPANVPSDIQVCGNHLYKPIAWKAEPWFAKDLLEITNARRVLVAGNVLENSWSATQDGFAVVLTPRSENGAVPGVVHDVTFTLNRIVHAANGIGLSGSDGVALSSGSQRIVITNNLIENINRNSMGGLGRVFQVLTPQNAAVGLEITHNTVPLAGNAFFFMGDYSIPVASNFFFQDNLVAHGDYGAYGANAGEGTVAFNVYTPGGTFANNAIFGGGMAEAYPAGNLFLKDAAEVGFVDFAGGDFALIVNSSLANAGSAGKAIGADVPAVREAVAGVVR